VRIELLCLKEDSVRAGLGSRVAGPEYFERDALVTMSDRGLLVRRFVIPARGPDNLDSTGIE